MRKVGWFFVGLLFFVVGMVGIVVASVVITELGWFPTSTFRIEEPWSSGVLLVVLSVGFLLGRASRHGKMQRGGRVRAFGKWTLEGVVCGVFFGVTMAIMNAVFGFCH